MLYLNNHFFVVSLYLPSKFRNNSDDKKPVRDIDLSMTSKFILSPHPCPCLLKNYLKKEENKQIFFFLPSLLLNQSNNALQGGDGVVA